MVVKEVPCFKECLDSDDVFIFDAGLELYQVRLLLQFPNCKQARQGGGDVFVFILALQLKAKYNCEKSLRNTYLT